MQLNVVAAADVPAMPSDSGPYPPASNEVSQQVPVHELLKAYEGWGPDVLNLLTCAEGVSKWNINVVYPHLRPDQWAKGRVAILGDAVSDSVASPPRSRLLTTSLGACDAPQPRRRSRTGIRRRVPSREAPRRLSYNQRKRRGTQMSLIYPTSIAYPKTQGRSSRICRRPPAACAESLGGKSARR